LGGVCVAALTVWALLPDGGPGKFEPRSRTRSIIVTLVLIVIVMIVFSLGRGGANKDVPRSAGAGQGAPPAAQHGEGSTTPSWGLGGAGVVLLLAVAGAVAYRRRVEPLDLPPDEPMPVIATLDERIDAVAAAEACADPRQAVLLAFAAAVAPVRSRSSRSSAPSSCWRRTTTSAACGGSAPTWSSSPWWGCERSCDGSTGCPRSFARSRSGAAACRGHGCAGVTTSRPGA